MSIAKKYDAKKIEAKWYQYWLKKGYFYSEPDDRESYTIVIPPPNVTGVLHMGHMLNNTIQDIMIRKARMEGYNTCWVPGTDHASIATEAKVVERLNKKGIKKTDLSREEFLKHAWKWKEEHGGIILEQLKKLGASCDWKRTKFTMDKDLSESVIDIFIDLYNKGLIYRGIRMINWDSVARTAVSDEEVIHKEVNSKLFHLRYKIKETNDWITIATTRPETILGDTAICVNPKDKRYKNLKGKHCIIPLVEREIPIIYDEYVDMEFGTGALKVTPAHDINDYELGNKHNLNSIDILNDDGTINEKAKLYVGLDRFEVRKKIIADLQAKGYLIKIESIKNKVGFSERTDSIIEPKLSMQWFVKMEKLCEPALENVMNDNINFYPKKFKNTYRHWMTNIKDWCISRQLWWGHRIPAYFYEGNKYVVAKTKDEAFELAKKQKKNISIEDLHQDEDVLDTWFSSWLWPISVFDGIRNPNNKEINYYYPTNDLVTAPEILFFWVARMIMAGYEYKKDMPFKNVYLTGIVRDKEGRKMSKSLGNSPDPISLIDKYGADGVRVGMLLCSPAGNDLPFDEILCEQGRNFSNKIWNAFRLIKGLDIRDCTQPESARQAILWFENKLNQQIEEINESYSKYRISEALMSTYKLIWDDFCSWYLEIIKPNYGESIDSTSYDKTIEYLENILKLLHPFMPFLSEEIWHLIKERQDDIIVASWPKASKVKEIVLEDFDIVSEVVSTVRNFRLQKQISNKEQVSLFVKVNKNDFCKDMDPIIIKLANISSINYTKEKIKDAFSFIVQSNEYFIPFEGNLNIEEEIKKLNKELDYMKGFLKSVENKLLNKKFTDNAPKAVVDIEKKKAEDAKAKIEILTNNINDLK
ncbi:MAG: valine--tRNA ligase [Bacteroidota bacterium]|nr:valine--tRNA ligase [Bacteroidota bacterium]